MNLAQQIALDIAEGRQVRLPRLTRAATPEFARDLLAALYRLRDAMERIRAQESAGWSIRDRVAASSVVGEIEGAIVDARAWLSRMARRGGRGVPVQSEGAQAQSRPAARVPA